jgi:hypothetical protein
VKLPTNKKERIQVFVLMAIGGVAVLYAGVQLGIRPMIEKKAAYRQRIAQLGEDNSKAERKVQLMRRDLSDNRDALQTICKEADNYILKATIGENYLLGVDDVLQRCSRAAKVPVGSPSEVGISDVPHNAARATRNVLKAYTARVTFRGGYSDMVRLLREIEATSPYVCVSAVTVSPQPDPEVHAITIDIQWPIWAEKGMADRLKQQLADNAAAEGKQ